MTVTQTAWQGGMARVDAAGAMVSPGNLAPPGHAEGAREDIPRTGDAHRPDATARTQTRGDVILDLQNISLAFGGVKALTDI